MLKFNSIARQGDVLLVRIDSLPKNLKPVEREGGRVILAHGEVTGHAHAIAERHVQHFRMDDTVKGEDMSSKMMRNEFQGTTKLRGGGLAPDTFLLIENKPATLQHEEHGAISLDPGVYRVIRQREYQDGELRNVAD